MIEARLHILGFLAALVGALFLITTPSSTAQSSGSGSVLLPQSLQPRLLITEILSNPIGVDDTEWIEVGNIGSGSIQLGGLSLMVGTKKFLIPLNTGSLLLPKQYRLFPKTETTLTLTNTGGEAKILSGTVIIDSLVYPETGEEVSYGRNLLDPLLVQPFCVPTPGAKNDDIPFNPKITVQSGELVKKESTSINLVAEFTGGGSLTHAACHWEYSDGFVSDSCNPPARTFKDVGPFTMKLTVQTMCGFIERSLSGEILPEESSSSSIAAQKFSSSLSSTSTACSPSVFSGISITEILPNPSGDDGAGEWIELQNTTSSSAQLCGWSLDDEEGGSVPFTLTDITIPALGFVAVQRPKSGIALNNDRDTVRLFAPATSGVYEEVSYERSPEDESYAKVDDSFFDWTPYLTPGLENQFEQVVRDSSQGTVIVSAALPNPKEDDRYHEWIEVQNIGTTSAVLDGWMIDNRDGASPAYVMSGITLAPAATKRFSIKTTQIMLSNSADSVRLMDPSGTVISAFAWKDAEEGMIYRLPFLSGIRVPVKILKVVDGDTIDIAFTDMDSLKKLPESVRRRWLAAGLKANPSLRVRLIGVNTKETVHPKLSASELGTKASEFMKDNAEGKTGVIEFDAEIWDTYDRMLGYVYLDSGESLQRLLLQNGLATVFAKFPFAKQTEYELLAAQAEEPVVEKESEDLDSEMSFEESEMFSEQFVSYQTGVVISEVYASPNTSETEWIELYNETDMELSIGGWVLDDILSGGSHAWKIPVGTMIGAGEYLVFTKEDTKLSLNNDADEVSLLLPDGSVVSSMKYGKHAKGSALTFAGEEFCETSTPTPGAENSCTQEVKAATTKKSSTTKSTQVRAKAFTIPVKYKNVSDEEPQVLSSQFVGTSGMYTDLGLLSRTPVSLQKEKGSGGIWSGMLGGVVSAVLILLIWQMSPKFLNLRQYLA